MKKPDYYWYEEMHTRTVIMGIRGSSEYTVNLWDFQKAYMRRRVELGRDLTPEEAYKICIIESQYVDFEEVKTSKLSLLTEKTLL